VPRTRPPFPPEFRAEVVRLMGDSDELLSQLAKDLGVSEQTLGTWRRQAEDDVVSARGSPASSSRSCARCVGRIAR
jgi:transposase